MRTNAERATYIVNIYISYSCVLLQSIHFISGLDPVWSSGGQIGRQKLTLNCFNATHMAFLWDDWTKYILNSLSVSIGAHLFQNKIRSSTVL